MGGAASLGSIDGHEETVKADHGGAQGKVARLLCDLTAAHWIAMNELTTPRAIVRRRPLMEPEVLFDTFASSLKNLGASLRAYELSLSFDTRYERCARAAVGIAYHVTLSGERINTIEN